MISPVFDERDIRERLGSGSGHRAMIPLVQNIPGIYTDHRGENDRIALTLLDQREKLDLYRLKVQRDIAQHAKISCIPLSSASAFVSLLQSALRKEMVSLASPTPVG